MINLEDILKNIPISSDIIILLIITLILSVVFKKFKPQFKKMSQDEKNKKGSDYELLVGKFYEEQGYKIYQKGIIENLEDGGIDIIATKENETLLIQCKNWNIDGKYKIRIKEIREFYGSCNFYIEDENIDKSKTTCIYIVPNDKLIPTKSKAMFKKYKYKCRYKIIKFEKKES